MTCLDRDVEVKLFRQEVIDAKRESRLGGIRVQPPRIGWFLTAISVSLIGVLVLFGVFGTYTRFERLEGRLVPKYGQIDVRFSRASIVTRVHVQTGARVRKGDPLVSVSERRISSALGDTEVAVSRQLGLKKQTLAASLEDQDKLLAEKRDAFSQRLSISRLELEEIHDQERIQVERAEAAERIFEKWSADGKDVISAVQIAQQRDQMLQARARVSELRQQRLRLQREIAQTQADLASVPLEIEASKSGLAVQLADVAQAQAENEASRESVLRAPVDGVVTSVLVNEGQNIDAASLLASLQPDNSPLMAELWAPSKSIGRVRQDSMVVLRFDSFPYQRYGTHRGIVATIDSSASSPELVGKALGKEIKEPRYRVLVALDKSHVERSGMKDLLHQGMSMSADVLSTRKRIVEILFEPLSNN
jgi:membrane fusion protein